MVSGIDLIEAQLRIAGAAVTTRLVDEELLPAFVASRRR